MKRVFGEQLFKCVLCGSHDPVDARAMPGKAINVLAPSGRRDVHRKLSLETTFQVHNKRLHTFQIYLKVPKILTKLLSNEK